MENWKQIDIYDGRYWISNMANFKTTYNHFTKKRIPSLDNGILLSTHIADYLGRKTVQLTIDKKVTKGAKKGKRMRPCFSVHVLVAKYFVSNPLKYSGLKFIDGNRSNPIATNLKWFERGADRIFPSIAERNKYLNSLVYTKLDWIDKSVYNYLKGDEKALNTLLKDKNVKQYLGKVLINAGLTKRYEIKDIILNSFIIYIKHIKEGRYRMIHLDQKTHHGALSYLSKLVTTEYYNWRKIAQKEPRVRFAKANEYYTHIGNRSQNLYTKDMGISDEIVELFNEYN